MKVTWRNKHVPPRMGFSSAHGAKLRVKITGAAPLLFVEESFTALPEGAALSQPRASQGKCNEPGRRPGYNCVVTKANGLQRYS